MISNIADMLIKGYTYTYIYNMHEYSYTVSWQQTTVGPMLA